MFIRILNREYALNVDKTAYNKVLFLATKFFMLNILQMPDSEMVFNYAMKVAGNISPIAIKRINDTLTVDAYKDISTFIESLAKVGYLIINGLDKITVRDYVAKYIRMYGNASLFALEHLSYFIFAIVSTVNRAHLTDIYAWEAALGSKSGDKVYAYIVNAVKRS
jgi:molybdopterin/thiamine biosynthesis adenylyltransferase